MTSLWGDDFEIKDTVKESKKIISKINQPKEVKKDSNIRASLKSKKLSLEDKLNIIELEKEYQDMPTTMICRKDNIPKISSYLENFIF